MIQNSESKGQQKELDGKAGGRRGLNFCPCQRYNQRHLICTSQLDCFVTPVIDGLAGGEREELKKNKLDVAPINFISYFYHVHDVQQPITNSSVDEPP